MANSQPELVFIHIPKTAGTTQKRAFSRWYGKENIFWWGEDYPQNTEAYPTELIGDRFVVGGHKPFDFYPECLDPLYCAVLRDPIHRAISLFCYHTQPHLATNESEMQERERMLDIAKSRGFDPCNMIRSIENSEEFRLSVSNAQCAYLTNGPPTYDEAMRTFDRRDFLVGESSRYIKFNRLLSALLGKPPFYSTQTNRSISGYMDPYLEDKRLNELLHELNVEDYRLFERVYNAPHGVFTSIKDLPHRMNMLSRPTCRDHRTDEQSDTDQADVKTHKIPLISIYSKGFLGIHPSGRASTSLVLFNVGDLDLSPELFPDMALICELRGNTSVSLTQQSVTCPVSITLDPGESITYPLEFFIAQEDQKNIRNIKIRFSTTPDSKSSEINPLLDCSAEIVFV